MDIYYHVHKAIIDKYSYCLSPAAFVFLIRFYQFYAKNPDRKKIILPYRKFHNSIQMCSNDEANLIWSELDHWNLMNRNHKENSYELNLTEILKECNVNYTSTFTIKVKSEKSIIGRRKHPKQFVDQYIDRALGRFPSDMVKEQLAKMISGVKLFLGRRKNKISVLDMCRLMNPFMRAETDDILKVCEIYNDPSKYGKKGTAYIHGILKNIEEDEKFAVVKMKSKSQEYYKKKSSDNQKKMALKIATGEVEKSYFYKACVQAKNYDELKRLYNIGKKEAETQGLKVFTEYEWL